MAVELALPPLYALALQSRWLMMVLKKAGLIWSPEGRRVHVLCVLKCVWVSVFWRLGESPRPGPVGNRNERSLRGRPLKDSSSRKLLPTFTFHIALKCTRKIGTNMNPQAQAHTQTYLPCTLHAVFFFHTTEYTALTKEDKCSAEKGGFWIVSDTTQHTHCWADVQPKHTPELLLDPSEQVRSRSSICLHTAL